jgi:hypothetical protein
MAKKKDSKKRRKIIFEAVARIVRFVKTEQALITKSLKLWQNI